MVTSRTIILSSLVFALAGCPEDTMDPAGGTESGPDTSGPGSETDSGVFGDCGNDVLDEGEECDGADLAGMACADLGPEYLGGTLACGPSCTFDASGCELDPNAALIRLNELTSDSVIAGPFMSGSSDAIEIHNGGMGAADLSGWQLSDDPMLPVDRTYVFPEGTMLAGGEFLVVTALDMMTMQGDYPFGVNDSAEEELTLADAGGGVVDSLVVNGYNAVVSYCRIPDASGAWDFCVQTFGNPNAIADTACGNGTIENDEECDTGDLAGGTCDGLGLGFSGGTLACSGRCEYDSNACVTDSELVINELEAVVDDLEIFNGGAAAVDLSGYILTDDRINAAYDPQIDVAELVFPPGTMIGPGEYLVVQVGIAPGQHPFGLGMQGDTVSLVSLSPTTVIDHVTYLGGEAQTSYCRQPNGPGGEWTDGCSPSFGGPN